MQTITFHIPLKISTNKIYAGVHWTVRNKHKELFRRIPFIARPISEYPISCHYHFVLKGKLLDISNLAYMIKLIEDCLIAKGILENDTPKFVSEIKITTEKGLEDVCYLSISANNTSKASAT